MTRVDQLPSDISVHTVSRFLSATMATRKWNVSTKRKVVTSITVTVTLFVFKTVNVTLNILVTGFL